MDPATLALMVAPLIAKAAERFGGVAAAAGTGGRRATCRTSTGAPLRRTREAARLPCVAGSDLGGGVVRQT
jgi:hypothetical protein